MHQKDQYDILHTSKVAIYFSKMSLFLNTITFKHARAYDPGQTQTLDSSDSYSNEYGSRALTHITVVQKKICPTLLTYQLWLAGNARPPINMTHGLMRLKKNKECFHNLNFNGRALTKRTGKTSSVLSQVTIPPRQILSAVINSGFILVLLVYHIHKPTRRECLITCWGKKRVTHADFSPEQLLPGTFGSTLNSTLCTVQCKTNLGFCEKSSECNIWSLHH